MKKMAVQTNLLGGVLLVAGTAIGAGMLALPVATGFAGFVPSCLLFLFFWGYMTFTALLVTELTLSSDVPVNLVTMARYTLGVKGAFFSWVVYLFLLYALTTSYLSGASPLVAAAFEGLTGQSIPLWMGSIPLFGGFGFFIYKGAAHVDRANRLLMLFLFSAYLLLLFFLAPHVRLEPLRHADPKALPWTVPIVATSFGFHIIIPSLVYYMNGREKEVRKAIFIGGLLTVLVYISWEFVTLGIVPLEGAGGIAQGYREGSNGATVLASWLGHSAIAFTAEVFSFFCIATSFLGVALSLSDFLADGLGVKKNRKGRLLLSFLTFLPPLAIMLIDPRAFLSALEYAGAFGVMILLGFLPPLMVWRLRYVKERLSSFRAPGGKLSLLATMAVALAVVIFEIFNKVKILGWFS